MNGVLIDSNVILDIFTNDPKWSEWSELTLEKLSINYELYINPIIYSEISIGFHMIEDLEKAVAGCGFKMIQFPREALFLAGKAFIKYKRQKGIKKNILPDFFIGAHAAVSNLLLVTRDYGRYKTYYPSISIINP